MIECVPNFSEGRRPEVIAAIAAAIADVEGVAVLDIHTDPDHNRSVITFAGAPEAVAEAAFRGVRAAAHLIDMRAHQGQHPRVGAADVVPFVPLRGATLAQCVEIARAVGRRIGEELHIPVYLYEAAATRPDRKDLPNLRRGGYEGLREAIERDPDRAPNFGPTRLGSAGATVVGAREPLIAYNVFLNSGDEQIARRVARAVRGSSGGLRGVRALGMLVGGRAQVSMNLIDYRTTPLHRAVELVAREAAAYGVAISESELVGLIPEDALLDAARFYLRLHTLRDDQVLERRLTRIVEAQARREQPSSQEASSWTLTIEALAAAARELAETHGDATWRMRLGALVSALAASAIQEAESPEGLLDLAQHASQLSETLSDMARAGVPIERARIAALAFAVAEGARARALPLLSHLLDTESRARIERELAVHARRAAELAAEH